MTKFSIRIFVQFILQKNNPQLVPMMHQLSFFYTGTLLYMLKQKFGNLYMYYFTMYYYKIESLSSNKKRFVQNLLTHVMIFTMDTTCLVI